MKINRIDLIGYRGAGKSTVGAILAERLGWEFIDSDAVIEQQTGRTIVEMFEKDVAEFRQLEMTLVRSFVGRTNVVIAWGGGVVLANINRIILDEQYCVWLTADPEELFRRTQADLQTGHHRPALTGLPGLAEVEQVLGERKALYAEVAKLTVSTADKTPTEVADQIMEHLLENNS